MPGPIILDLMRDFDSWSPQAACRNHPTAKPDYWFPASTTGRGRPSRTLSATTRIAQQICNTECPVKEQCLDYALRAGEKYGIWGGALEQDRLPKRIRRRPEHEPALAGQNRVA